jgi:hypothetical protein
LVALAVASVLLAAGAADAQEKAGAGISADAIAKANNPLADMNAFNFQNYYSPSLYGVPDAFSNTMNLRGVMVAGRQIIRATLPVSTVPTGNNDYASGLGDLNIFDAIVVYDKGTQIGVGPLLVIPTNTENALGAGDTWQAGLAAVAVKPITGGSMIGTLVTWQTDFAGGDDRVDTSVMATQIFLTMSVGGGWYVRSSPLAVFDVENDRYMVPFGLGVGKVFKMGGAVVNAFIEPQFTMYHDGAGWPTLQTFTGLNFQFPKG